MMDMEMVEMMIDGRIDAKERKGLGMKIFDFSRPRRRSRDR